MSRNRRLDATALILFLAATVVQFLFHAHVGSERHHDPSCIAAGGDVLEAPGPAHMAVASSQAVALKALPDDDSSLPLDHHHGACPRCVAPAAALRFEAGIAVRLLQTGSVAVAPGLAWIEPSSRLGYEQRGPPRA